MSGLEKKIKLLMKLLKKLPHLPEISETQATLFLQKWDCDPEKAKDAIDKYFTFKTRHADLFFDRNPFVPSMQQALDVFLVSIFPKKTPEGHSIFFVKVMDPDIEKLDLVAYVKLFDMVTTLNLFQKGASKGYIIVLDIASMPDGILGKVPPSLAENFFYYMQELNPWNLVAMHYFNTITYLDQLLDLVEPFFTVFKDKFHVHSNAEELSKYVPLEYLPEDYGGSLESTHVLQKNVKALLEENVAFFEWEDGQRVHESRRIELGGIVGDDLSRTS